MTLEGLKDYKLSEYNEGTSDQLDYYLNEKQCKVGDSAYLYSHHDKKLSELKIIKIINCSDDPDNYFDNLIENHFVLVNGEEEFNADTSAEFITDSDSYLVWFKYA